MSPPPFQHLANARQGAPRTCTRLCPKSSFDHHTFSYSGGFRSHEPPLPQLLASKDSQRIFWLICSTGAPSSAWPRSHGRARPPDRNPIHREMSSPPPHRHPRDKQFVTPTLLMFSPLTGYGSLADTWGLTLYENTNNPPWC